MKSLLSSGDLTAWRTHRTERRHSPYVKNDYYTSKQFHNIHNALDVNTPAEVIAIRPLLRALFPSFILRDTPDTSSDLSNDIWHMYHDEVPNTVTIPDESIVRPIAQAIASQRLDFIKDHWITYYPSHKIVDLSEPLPETNIDPTYAPTDSVFHPPKGYATAKNVIDSIQASGLMGSFFLMPNGKFLQAGVDGHAGTWTTWLELSNLHSTSDNVQALAIREQIAELTGYPRPDGIPEIGISHYTDLTPAQEGAISYLNRHSELVITRALTFAL